jgi:nucleotide-binding universal stress UspA family protein
MIIVATRERLRLERVIFGDIAEQIARTSPVPVPVINPEAQM